MLSLQLQRNGQTISVYIAIIVWCTVRLYKCPNMIKHLASCLNLSVQGISIGSARHVTTHWSGDCYLLRPRLTTWILVIFQSRFEMEALGEGYTQVWDQLVRMILNRAPLHSFGFGLGRQWIHTVQTYWYRNTTNTQSIAKKYEGRDSIELYIYIYQWWTLLGKQHHF